MQPLRTRTPSPSPPSSSQHFPPGTTRPSPPRFHLHPAQPPPPPPKQPWAHGATAARGALNLEGRVQHIARPTHTPPPSLLLPGRPQTKDWAWVLRALTRAKRGDGTRCYLNLPHTVLLTGGAAHGCWAFTSAQRGVVLRKHEAHATDLAHLQAEFLRAAAASPRPRLAVPRPRGSEGFGGFASSRSFSSASLSLPAPLAQMGVEPEAVVALAQSEVGGSGAQQQRPIDALELLQMCQSGAFPPGARTLQAFVPEKGASVALVGSVGGGSGGAAASSASSGGEGVQTLVPGSTFQHEYSLGRLGAPLHRTSRCVSRSLFGGRGGPGPGGPAARKGEQVGPAAAATAAGAAADEEEGEALDGEGRGAATTRAGSSLSSWDRRSALELELELLPSTNRALNQAMADAALQVVMHVESASGGKVQRLLCEFCLDARDKLWLRRTLDCQVLVPERKKREEEEESKSGDGRRRPRSGAVGAWVGKGEEGGWGSDGEEAEGEERVLPWLPPPPSIVLPGHHIEERIGRRASRREVAVDEGEVTRILGGKAGSISSSGMMGI